MQDSVGKPLVRVDGRAKVTGQAVYAAEQRIPNCAYAVMVMSTIAKGRIIAIETRAAERTARVLAVLTHQPIAAVVAETLEDAEEAARLVRARYAPQAHSVELDANAGRAYTLAKGGAHGEKTDDRRGDVAAAMGQAEKRIEHVYRTQFQTPNPMEPHATVAAWDGPDRLTLYDATQGRFRIASGRRRCWDCIRIMCG